MEGRYIVTSFGDFYRIKNGERKNVNKFVTSKGRQVVYLDNGVNSRQYSVGKIVARCFVDNPEGYSYVNYIDGDPTNNVYTNLVWSPHNMPRTARQEKRKSESEILRAYLQSTPPEKISYNQSEVIRGRLNGQTYAQIAKRLNISKQAANKIILNITGNNPTNKVQTSLLEKRISELEKKILKKESRISILEDHLNSAKSSLDLLKSEADSLTRELQFCGSQIIEGDGETV